MFKVLGQLLSAVFGRKKKKQTGGTDPLPPATPKVVDVTVWSGDGTIITDAEASLHIYQFPGEMVQATKAPDGLRYRFVVPPTTTMGWGADLILVAPGHHDTVIGVVLGPSLDVEMPAVDTLADIRPEGEFFTADGQPLTIIEATDFQLFQRFLAGENIRPVLRQRKAVGFNTVRVLGMCQWMFTLNPLQHGDRYYDTLRDFFETCDEEGLYVEFVAFADTKLIMPMLDQQLTHWALVGRIAQEAPNVLLELVNENSEHENAVADTDAFSPISGVPCSHGSNGSEAMPVRPTWDYETFHYNDAGEWQRKTAHNPMEDGYWQTRTPAMANENTRFPDRCDRAELAYDAARGAALLSAGSCFHSVRGKNSLLWDGLELECARAWAEGARSVDLGQRRHPYINVSSQYPDYLRAYSRGNVVALIRR